MPDNYHGNAFTELEEDTLSNQQEVPDTTQVPAEAPQAQDTLPTPKKEEGGLLSSLFSGLGGMRSDDLLLIALIVLLWRSGDQSAHGTSEILPLLAILLFMG